MRWDVREYLWLIIILKLNYYIIIIWLNIKRFKLILKLKKRVDWFFCKLCYIVLSYLWMIKKEKGIYLYIFRFVLFYWFRKYMNYRIIVIGFVFYFFVMVL